MRRAQRPQTLSPHEFELDLAPLLAVMVKLVPVLLISSAFVQVMMVESDLPQAVKEAIKKDEQKPTANVQIQATSKGLTVIVQKGGAQTTENVPMKDGSYDYANLHKTLQKVKSANPEVFKVELNPDANIPYKEVVRITDEARRSRDKDVRFPLFDAKENKTVQTDYMFPDVVFSNVFDG